MGCSYHTELEQRNTHCGRPVLVELFYMTMIRINYERAVQAMASTRAAFQIEPLTDADMDRMQQLITDYQDAGFDFTDAAIIAVAEWLKITQVGTFNRWDFSIFRPSHYS